MQNSFTFGSVEIRAFSLGALDTNCYLVWDSDSGEGMVIDPSDEGGFISDQVLETGMDLKQIVLTHAHFDHILGLLELNLNFEVPVYLHPEDFFLFEKCGASAQHWLRITVPQPPLPSHHLTPETTITLGEHHFQILETPGHTPGSVSLFLSATNDQPPLLFSGDCLFKSGIGRTDFSYSSTLQMNNSLHTLLTLPPETVVFSGHGEETTIGQENRQR